MKLGCGQSEVSATLVARAAGAKLNDVEPEKIRSVRNVKAPGGVESWACHAAASASRTWMPLKLAPGTPTLGAKASSSVPLILMVEASLRPATSESASTSTA